MTANIKGKKIEKVRARVQDGRVQKDVVTVDFEDGSRVSMHKDILERQQTGKTFSTRVNSKRRR